MYTLKTFLSALKRKKNQDVYLLLITEVNLSLNVFSILDTVLEF